MGTGFSQLEKERTNTTIRAMPDTDKLGLLSVAKRTALFKANFTQILTYGLQLIQHHLKWETLLP
jgi:hypothetical protein